MFGHHPKFYHEYDLLNHMYDITDEDGCILTVLDEDTLKSIPYVETPIVHAHWIKAFFPDSVECGLPILLDATCSHCDFKMEELYSYCPNCGAIMDEEV